MIKPGTIEAARLCADEAAAPLHGIDGLLTHPFTEAKRNMVRNRLRTALHALQGALASVETVELEPPFIPSLLPQRGSCPPDLIRGTEGVSGPPQTPLRRFAPLPPQGEEIAPDGELIAFPRRRRHRPF